MEASNSVEVAFDGTKFYWRTRNTVDVVIVHHKACKTFEVIVYEPTLDMEAPRLYLSEEILMPNVDHNEIDSRISFAKRNNVPITEKFVSGIVNKAVSDFILNRLVITELVASKKKFLVELQIDDKDISVYADFEGLICARPDALAMYRTKHYKNLMQSAVVAVMQALEEDKKEIQKICGFAEEMSNRVSPIVRDRWRMPIVLNKVFRGARLSYPDKRVFERIKSNMKTDEDIARMHAVMRTTKHIKHLEAHSPSQHTSVHHKKKHTSVASVISFHAHPQESLGAAEAHPHAATEPRSPAHKVGFNTHVQAVAEVHTHVSDATNNAHLHEVPEKTLHKQMSFHAHTQGPPEMHTHAPLMKELSFQADTQMAAAAHGHASELDTHAHTQSTAGAHTHVPLQRELSKSRRSDGDSTSPTMKGHVSKAGSHGEAPVEEVASSPITAKKHAHKKTKAKSASKAAHGAPGEVTDGADHSDPEPEAADEAEHSSTFERVVAGLNSLGATLLSGFPFGRGESVSPVAEGCEESAPGSLSQTSAGPVVQPDSQIAAVTAEAAHSGVAFDPELDAPASVGKSMSKSNSYLGGIMQALTRGRSGEIPITAAPSHHGPVAITSSKKIVPAQ